MTIGELASRIGVTTRTIRWYEQQGLLNGRERERYQPRRYDAEALHRTRLIRRARMLGLSLQEIKPLVDAHQQDPTERKVIEESIRVLSVSLAKMEQKIRDATETHRMLRHEIERLTTLLREKPAVEGGTIKEGEGDGW